VSSEFLDPISNPSFWDVVTIAGVDSPGLCVVSKAPRAHKYDVKTGKGTKGSTTTFVGLPPADFSIKFMLWLVEHFQAWGDFRPLLRYDPTKKKGQQAVDIFYPSLADLSIFSVVTTEIGSIVHEGKQLYSIEVSFLEYLPASKTSAVSTPAGSQWYAGPGADGKPKPGAQPDPAIAEAQKQVNDLANQAQGASQ
jgi:hypothetical protein